MVAPARHPACPGHRLGNSAKGPSTRPAPTPRPASPRTGCWRSSPPTTASPTGNTRSPPRWAGGSLRRCRSANSTISVAAGGGVVIASLYLPDDNPQPGPKFDYKFDWFDRFIDHAAGLLHDEMRRARRRFCHRSYGLRHLFAAIVRGQRAGATGSVAAFANSRYRLDQHDTNGTP